MARGASFPWMPDTVAQGSPIDCARPGSAATFARRAFSSPAFTAIAFVSRSAA